MDNKKIKYVIAGAVAGYFGQYIGDQITNFIRNEKEPLSIISSDNAYIASIIAGGVTGAFITDLTTFRSVIVSVGIFYGVFESLEVITNDSYVGREDTVLLKDFIYDVVIVYILIMFWNNTFSKKKNTEDQLISDQIVANIINGIVVTSYYSGKRIIKS